MVTFAFTKDTMKKGDHQMDSVAATVSEEAEVVESLRSQLAQALSLLMSLGFDMTDLIDYLWT